MVIASASVCVRACAPCVRASLADRTNPGLPRARARRATGVCPQALHWRKIPASRLPADSVWASFLRGADGGCAAEGGMAASDVVELTELFAIREAGQKALAQQQQGAPTRQPLLDLRRANNVGITFAKLGRLSAAQIGECARCVDARRLLTVDELMALLRLVPSESERELFASALASASAACAALSPPEQLVGALCEVPQLERKLKAAITTRTFPEAADIAHAAIAALSAAATAAPASTALRCVLRWFLSVGNALNANTARGGAVGFEPFVLPSTRDIKAASDPALSLMHCVVRQMRAQGGASARALDCLGEELSALPLETEGLDTLVAIELQLDQLDVSDRAARARAPAGTRARAHMASHLSRLPPRSSPARSRSRF